MVVFAKDFDEKIVSKVKNAVRPAGNPCTTEVRTYKDIVCAFDIETTRIDAINQSVMYVWQFQIGGHTIIGRTWEELEDLMIRISGVLNAGEYLVVYDHNLSFEFQFLKGWYFFEKNEVFALDSRQVLKCDMFKHFEFRCSYLLTLSPLDKFLNDMGVEHCKVSGFDYDAKRYSWTPWDDFSAEEREYICNDVIGLSEAIRKKMRLRNDTLYTIPLTATGYVRRVAREVLKSHQRGIQSILPDNKTFNLLRLAFRGGDVHASRFYVGETIRKCEDSPGVASFDRSSAYLYELVHRQFPVTAFKSITNPSINDVLRYCTRRGMAVLCRLVFTGLELVDEFEPFPYIAKERCIKASGDVCDNGRILKADAVELALTDIDLNIILRQYRFDTVNVIEAEYAKYGMLPDALRNFVIDSYKKKTTLKNIPGKELEYAQTKAEANAIYGMMVQNPVRVDVNFDAMDGFSKDTGDIEKKLASWRKKAFLPYQWGVWTTAWARLSLHEICSIAGKNAVYKDTDCCKFIDDGTVSFDEYNSAVIDECEQSGAYAVDSHGVTHYLGALERESADGGYYEFKTMGAKKYAVRAEEGGKITITIAGVPKEDGASELDAAGGMDAFEEGMTFRDCKMDVIYNDANFGDYEIDNHKLYISSNATFVPGKYEIGIAEEYRSILADARERLFNKTTEELDRISN